MSAFERCDYTDDGCTVWECTVCREGIEMRDDGSQFNYCPYCGEKFTHHIDYYLGDETDIQKLRRKAEHVMWDRRRERSDKEMLYALRVWVPNPKLNDSMLVITHVDDLFYYPEDHDEEEREFSKRIIDSYWGDSYEKIMNLGGEPMLEYSLEPFILKIISNLTPEKARESIKEYHGCPKSIVRQCDYDKNARFLAGYDVWRNE